MSKRVEHLRFIQGAIARMALHSFAIKGWSITVVSGVGALAVVQDESLIALVGLFPAIAFWMLDAYYVRQERLFRRLWDAVAQIRYEAPPRFAMETRQFRKLDKFSGAALTFVVWGIHGLGAVALGIIAIVVAAD